MIKGWGHSMNDRPGFCLLSADNTLGKVTVKHVTGKGGLPDYLARGDHDFCSAEHAPPLILLLCENTLWSLCIPTAILHYIVALFNFSLLPDCVCYIARLETLSSVGLQTNKSPDDRLLMATPVLYRVKSQLFNWHSALHSLVQPELPSRLPKLLLEPDLDVP